jgi:hypothetical protein
LLVVGATAVIRHTKDKPTPMAAWISPTIKVVAIGGVHV